MNLWDALARHQGWRSEEAKEKGAVDLAVSEAGPDSMLPASSPVSFTRHANLLSRPGRIRAERPGRCNSSWPSAVTDNDCVSLSALWGPRRQRRPSDNICLELRRLRAGGNSAAFEVNRRIKQRGAAPLCGDATLVQRDGRNRSGERPTSRDDPGAVSRYLLPRVPPPYAAIPKDRQARAIWPHFGFPGHILGIQTMPPPRLSPDTLCAPSLRVVSAPPLHPCLSVGSSGRGPLPK
ncbi:hypothetical protein EYF80_005761 [Liparis tanakae]|uniref:Uncharacterized protein n=1 Tax=Liparis tanakae TaxID=230148 RepID=A0A4Z2J0U4_9TELE|nr:hypothetical protein EYF80_005761 [Liparis tanakae]